MYDENLEHRKALEQRGWLQDGKVICYWSRKNGCPVSFYVVAYKSLDNKITIDCIRVFGEIAGSSVHISVDKRIGDWDQIFGEIKNDKV